MSKGGGGGGEKGRSRPAERGMTALAGSASSSVLQPHPCTMHKLGVDWFKRLADVQNTMHVLPSKCS